MRNSVTNTFTYAQLIAEGQKVLGGGSDTRQRCISLLALLANSSELKLRTKLHSIVSPTETEAYFKALTLLKDGVPDAYVGGIAYFYSYPIHVGPGVLIPRPDTEVLLLEALACLKKLNKASKNQSPLEVLEPCTGTACLTLTLAKEWVKQETDDNALPLRIHATEISDAALGFAKKNLAELITAQKVILEKADLWPEHPQSKFDILISNPPYVSESEYTQLEDSVKLHEPALALLAGEDGLDFYRRIFNEGAAYLRSGAYVLLEHGYQQPAAVKALAAPASYRYLYGKQDLAGRDRISVFQYIAEEEGELTDGR